MKSHPAPRLTIKFNTTDSFSNRIACQSNSNQIQFLFTTGYRPTMLYQVEIHEGNIVAITVKNSISGFDSGVSGHAIFIRRLNVQSFLVRRAFTHTATENESLIMQLFLLLIVCWHCWVRFWLFFKFTSADLHPNFPLLSETSVTRARFSSDTSDGEIHS